MLSKHVFWTVSTIARPHSFPNASLKNRTKKHLVLKCAVPYLKRRIQEIEYNEYNVSKLQSIIYFN